MQQDASRAVYTSSPPHHQVTRLEQLRQDGLYVGVQRGERLHRTSYGGSCLPDHGTLPGKTGRVAQTRPLSRPARYMSWELPTCIYVFRNGDSFTPGKKFCFKRKDLLLWSKTLQYMSNELGLTTGCLQCLCDFSGNIILSGETLTMWGCYVACGNHDLHFKQLPYHLAGTEDSVRGTRPPPPPSVPTNSRVSGTTPVQPAHARVSVPVSARSRSAAYRPSQPRDLLATPGFHFARPHSERLITSLVNRADPRSGPQSSLKARKTLPLKTFQAEKNIPQIPVETSRRVPDARKETSFSEIKRTSRYLRCISVSSPSGPLSGNSCCGNTRSNENHGNSGLDLATSNFRLESCSTLTNKKEEEHVGKISLLQTGELEQRLTGEKLNDQIIRIERKKSKKESLKQKDASNTEQSFVQSSIIEPQKGLMQENVFPSAISIKAASENLLVKINNCDNAIKSKYVLN